MPINQHFRPLMHKLACTLAAVVVVTVVSPCNAAGTRGRTVVDTPGHHDGKSHSCIHDHVLGSMPPPQHARQAYHGEAQGPALHPLRGRALSSHCGTEYCPIRVTWELFDVTAGGALPQASIDFLRDVIMPAAVQRLDAMYLVKPLATNLALSRQCDGRCTSGAYQMQCREYSTPATCSLGDGATPVTIPATYFGEQVQGCSVGTQVTLPAAAGVANSDFHIFVRAEDTANCASGSTLAYAGTCQRDEQSDRPTVGVVNFCPGQISLEAADERGQIYTAIHELHHALGFSSGSWNLFRDQPNGGTPRTARSTTFPSQVAPAFVERVLQDSSGTCTSFPTGSAGPGQSVVSVQTPDANTITYFSERGIAECTTVNQRLQNGGCVARMVTSEATARARDFFGCATLQGVELENQRTSSACAVAGSHLEQRVFLQNFMAPVTSHHSIITPVEMGVMQDSGWYIANYSAADALSGEWGVGQGCAFASDKCLGLPKSAPVNVATTGGRPHFCTRFVDVNSHQACTVDRRAVGACSAVAGQSVPTEFSYFTDPSVGSVSPIQTDYCPYIKAFSNRVCSDVSQNTGNSADFGRVYGPDSLCASSTLLKTGLTTSNHVGVGCFTTACITAPLSASELTVIAGTEGLPPPTPTAPWLLLGASDPDTPSTVHYAACINGSASMNPAPGVFNGEFTCVDPAVFCAETSTNSVPVLPSPSPSPSTQPSPSPSPGAGGDSNSGAGGFLGTGLDEQYVYIGAGVLALLVLLACLWSCCCRSSKAAEAATQGGRYQPGQNIQMVVQSRTA